MNPSMLAPETRQLAQQLIQQQLADQLSGKGPPPITAAPKSGFLDKALGIGSFGAGMLGGLGKAGVFGPGKQPPIPNPTEGTGGLPDMTPRRPASIDIGIPQPPILPSRRIPGSRYGDSRPRGPWRMY